MENKNENNFGNFLYKKYTEWLTEQPMSEGNRKNFAKYLNISYTMLSEFMHGRRIPARRTLYSMAYVLGPEVYEALGVNRPTSGIEEVARRWNDLSGDTQTKIIELVRLDQAR